MTTLSYKCPNCGAPLIYQPGKEKSSCEYCKSEFSLEELEDFLKNEQSESEHTHEKTDEHIMGYSCKSCGAEVVTDETTTATFCYYCHNPIILTERLKDDFKPSKIIPFSIDKKVAEETLLKWAKTKRFVPSSFYSSSQLEKITGMYLPFWIAQVRADIDIEGIGKDEKRWKSGDEEFTETKIYEINRKGNIDIENIGELAFNKIDKEMIDSITPYNEEESKDFSLAYLSGFFAESYDKQKEDVENEIKRRMNDYTQSIISETISNYDSSDLRKKNIDYSILNWDYGLFPAWIMTYHYLGKTYVYAINGQTGRAYGELPLDKKKLGISSGIIGLVFLLIFIIGGWLIW